MIEVKELTKRYGDFTAVDNISFQVAPGEIFAFLGPNGAGKTTTIKMLTTLLRPTSGTMSLNGHDPTRQRDAVRRSFGIVFQDPSLDEQLTAHENLMFHAALYGLPREVRTERIEGMLQFMELDDRRNDLVKRFSGGMKRRLEIARGLLHHPRVLFLDEPTIGLDPQTRFLIWEHVKRLRETEGVTVFLTTHYLDEAERVADRVAVIDRGQIVASGTVAELLAQTKSANLEEAYLNLTGRRVRESEADANDGLRARVRANRLR
jgi:ABC-2 type transport system ATP-binding protein